jgi:hypothetical protein
VELQLRDVTDQTLLDRYYEQTGLDKLGTVKKIEHLRDKMHVTAVRLEYGTDLDDVLGFLEDSVLVDRWRWSGHSGSQD